VIITRIWLGMALAAALAARAQDWPQFLGPTRNGVADAKALADAWPAAGPAVLWQKNIGAGWSGPVISNGKLILFHRVDDKETVECFDAATGKPIWSGDYATSYRDDFGFDEGPRSTPAIDGNRVYTFGAEGVLSCWDLTNGNRIWNTDAKREYKAGKGFFGIVCSPLIEGDLVILNVGGKDGAGIVAFDKSNGQPKWRATDDEAGYSSPTAATIAGKRYVLSLTRAGLVALEPSTGKIFFHFPFRPRTNASVNAATPIVVDDQIFISASYDTGAMLLKFDEAGPKEIWSSDQSLSAHYATPVYRDGCLYGFDGRQEQGCNLRCVDFKTGQMKWSENGFGAGTLMLAGNDLLILHENGELIRAAASPDGFKVKQRAQILGHDTRAYAALAGGVYFARDKQKLVCLDLRKK
jgi:outer membrane protein assembly factor BamB